MSDKHQQWLDLVIAGTDLKSATMQVFDCKTDNSISAKTSVLKARYVDEINNALLKQMKMAAPAAFKTIMDLAQDCDQPAVKMKAAQDILDRTGYKPSLQVEDVTDRTPKTKEQHLKGIAEAIRELEEQGIAIGTYMTQEEYQKQTIIEHEGTEH